MAWDNSQPKHMAIVTRQAAGTWQGSCSCGWRGSEWTNHQLAVESKDAHLRDAMRPDPMAQWDRWMQGMTMEEPRWPEKA